MGKDILQPVYGFLKTVLGSSQKTDRKWGAFRKGAESKTMFSHGRACAHSTCPGTGVPRGKKISHCLSQQKDWKPPSFVVGQQV